MKQVRSLFSLSVGAIVHSASQLKEPKTKTKTTKGSDSNKGASSSEQGEVDPKTAGLVCISRDNRSHRDSSLFIRRNKRMMHPRSCQRGSVSGCAFTPLTLIVSLTIEYTRKKQVTLPCRLGASSTCPHGCCAAAWPAQMGRIDPCMSC